MLPTLLIAIAGVFVMTVVAAASEEREGHVAASAPARASRVSAVQVRGVLLVRRTSASGAVWRWGIVLCSPTGRMDLCAAFCRGRLHVAGVVRWPPDRTAKKDNRKRPAGRARSAHGV